MLEPIQRNANGRKLQQNTEAISWHLLASFLFNFRARLRLKQIDGIGPTLRSRGWTRQAAKPCQGVLPANKPRECYLKLNKMLINITIQRLLQIFIDFSSYWSIDAFCILYFSFGKLLIRTEILNTPPCMYCWLLLAEDIETQSWPILSSITLNLWMTCWRVHHHRYIYYMSYIHIYLKMYLHTYIHTYSYRCISNKTEYIWQPCIYAHINKDR